MAKPIKTDNDITLAVMRCIEMRSVMKEHFKNQWRVPAMKRELSRWEREKRRLP